jgi:hypothetical protein
VFVLWWSCCPDITKGFCVDQNRKVTLQLHLSGRDRDFCDLGAHKYISDAGEYFKISREADNSQPPFSAMKISKLAG